ncbi:hypothetical protein [Staphylococcus lutrae]|uniref:Uncharacterized protein n=1 Tax=Staphylococcus lutrae TaxID=155085 RepID=A0AAC9RTM5_9STAP|nr:hypothetical protein [Staphylococcus lutrae]ARJ51491.1 hypothetical protein B5P37_09310 [Staphylococcus lutrae]PNZ38680.1 hypothetical protein CD134_03830 [Staphylococcus lutrae]
MDAQVEDFLRNTSYTGAYVAVFADQSALYSDEACTQKVVINDVASTICLVRYEFEKGQKLAIQDKTETYFVHKQQVELLLYVDWQSSQNQIQLAHFDKEWKTFQLDTPMHEKVCPHQNSWLHIAQHLNVLQAVQERQHRFIVQKVLGDAIEKRHFVAQLIEQRETLKTRYLKLRHSKLGKIQIKLWERRS